MSKVKELMNSQGMNSQVYCGVHIAQSLGFSVVLCRSLFVLLSFFFWPLYFVLLIYSFLLPLWYLQTFLYQK